MPALMAHASLTLRERYTGLIYGSLTADSLALAAHWIYDGEEIECRFGRITEPLAAPDDGHHGSKERGAQTHYGDQALILLDSLDACGGCFVMEDFARRWRAFWKNSTTYRDLATRDTLAHLEMGRGLTRAGSDSRDLGGACRIAPLLLALRNEDPPTIIGAVRAQTAMTHAAPVVDAAEYLAQTLFLLMRGLSIPAALRMAADLPYRFLPVQDYLAQAERTLHLPVSEAVRHLGLSCAVDKALPSVFAILLHDGTDSERALIENVMAGGESAARGMVLGMILGAGKGHRAIPERWNHALQAHARIEAFLQTVGLGGEVD